MRKRKDVCVESCKFLATYHQFFRIYSMEVYGGNAESSVRNHRRQVLRDANEKIVASYIWQINIWLEFFLLFFMSLKYNFFTFM